MKILHYIPSIGKSGGGVSAYLQLLSHELGKLVELHIVTHHTHDEITLEAVGRALEGLVRRRTASTRFRSVSRRSQAGRGRFWTFCAQAYPAEPSRTGSSYP